jgi:hypothetical protein
VWQQLRESDVRKAVVKHERRGTSCEYDGDVVGVQQAEGAS